MKIAVADVKDQLTQFNYNQKKRASWVDSGIKLSRYPGTDLSHIFKNRPARTVVKHNIPVGTVNGHVHASIKKSEEFSMHMHNKKKYTVVEY